MKLKSLLFAICFSFVGHALAANQHLHPKANEATNNTKNAASKPSMYPGYCEIELVNASYGSIFVYGQFDDGAFLDKFPISYGDIPHYVSLHYYGYCHSGMRITIENIYGLVIYDRYTSVGSTVRVVPYLANGLSKSKDDNQVKVEVTKK